jgi:histidinol-phosphate/aromatic aminotransferase/cobyric acid decarboxylase-like protein
MHIPSGHFVRDEWKFTYTASKLAEGARAQKAFRESRVAWWTEQKAKVMAEIRESGLNVSESVAASISNYATSAMNGPQVTINADLQRKLGECHTKIGTHTNAVAEYDGWIQVLDANAEQRLELTQADWLYFFGKS